MTPRSLGDASLQCTFDGKSTQVPSAMLISSLGKRSCFSGSQFCKALKIPSRLPVWS